MSHLSHRFLYPDIEFLFILFLKNDGEVLDTLMQEGLQDRVDINLRPVIWRALENDAAILLLAHIHPTGIAAPSDGDKQMTRMIAEVSQRLGIGVMDHLIYGDGDWFSFGHGGVALSAPPDGPYDGGYACQNGREPKEQRPINYHHGSTPFESPLFTFCSL